MGLHLSGSTTTALNNAYVRSLPPSNGTDDTAALNALLTQGGMWRAQPGANYIVDADYLGGKSLRLTTTGTILDLTGATVTIKPNALDRHYAVTMVAADCAVFGGKIIGDVGSHLGTTGEMGYGVAILEAADRAVVQNTYITKMWGDGICIGDTAASYTTGRAPVDVRLIGVVADDNRRQGLSVVAAKGLRVIGGAFINTGTTAYTSPGAGIDVEPDSGSLQAATDFAIIGTLLSGNHGPGFSAASIATTGMLDGVESISNGAEGFIVGSAARVEMTGCTAKNNATDGFSLAPDTSSTPLALVGCKSDANTRYGFILSGNEAHLSSCTATNNGRAGFIVGGTRNHLTACSAVGNNQTLSTYGQISAVGATDARFVGCVSDAGSNTTKPGWAYQIDSTSTGVRLFSCSAPGTFVSGAFLNQGTNSLAFPMPAHTAAVATDELLATLRNLGVYPTTAGAVPINLQKGVLKTDVASSTAANVPIDVGGGTVATGGDLLPAYGVGRGNPSGQGTTIVRGGVADSTAHGVDLFVNGQNALGVRGNGTGSTLTISDGRNLVLGASPGTKIGTATTQKLAFWNATPIVQPSATPTAATDLATALTLVNDLRTKLLALGLIA